MNAPAQPHGFFQDQFELESFLELLNEWAEAPDAVTLHQISGEHSHIRNMVRKLLDDVVAIETYYQGAPNGSHQSDVLIELDEVLALTWHPSELATNLEQIRSLLFTAQLIANGIEHDSLKPVADAEKKRSDAQREAALTTAKKKKQLAERRKAFCQRIANYKWARARTANRRCWNVWTKFSKEVAEDARQRLRNENGTQSQLATSDGRHWLPSDNFVYEQCTHPKKFQD